MIAFGSREPNLTTSISGSITDDSLVNKNYFKVLINMNNFREQQDLEDL